MKLFHKRKIEDALQARKSDLQHLFDKYFSELVEVEKKLDNVAYQIEFFGSTPELEQEKKDCEILLHWLQDEFDQTKKGLFQVNKKFMMH